MWFEVIPSFAIITVALAIPSYATYHIHKLWIGNAYRRNTDQPWERFAYRRDMRINGNVYKGQGLESIPDE
ncbi:CLUMA_CG008959, isoform A [Clunio marinus]|uniref:NADH dehydrogenase [ubiquinone] 1 alpha subcomplex subunit 1 n=1 Tax=Clunio marinus TaxID=568069 RepID=A0A1J1I6X0_9DIPT|nr:CLUMA_CG008959, isoform A [Clunio marinus]